VRLTGAYETNPGLEEGSDADPTGSVWLAPLLEAEWRRDRVRVGGEAGADLRWYPQRTDLTEQFFRLRGWGELRLPRGFSFWLEDAFVPTPVELGLPEDDTSNLLQVNRVLGELRYRRELPRAFALEAAVGGSRLTGEPYDGLRDADNDGVLEDDGAFHPDYSEGAARAELQRGFGRRTTAYLRALARERWFDELPESDFSEVAGLAGVRVRGPARTEIELAGGYGRLDYAEGGPTPHVLGLAQVRGTVGAGWRWSGGIQRRFTGDVTGNEFVENTARVSLERQLGARTQLRIAAYGGMTDDHARNGQDLEWVGAELGIRRQITRHVQAGLVFRHWRSDGSLPKDSVRQNRVTLELYYRR
jgi:hypothetical protein